MSEMYRKRAERAAVAQEQQEGAAASSTVCAIKRRSRFQELGDFVDAVLAPLVQSRAGASRERLRHCSDSSDDSASSSLSDEAPGATYGQELARHIRSTMCLGMDEDPEDSAAAMARNVLTRTLEEAIGRLGPEAVVSIVEATCPSSFYAVAGRIIGANIPEFAANVAAGCIPPDLPLAKLLEVAPAALVLFLYEATASEVERRGDTGAGYDLLIANRTASIVL